MLTHEDYQGVSNCYVFKSRLQEYAQKVGLPTPVYETIKEGPSHQPSFRSTVIVNNVRYDSLPGFFNRKAAEQSAAEIALRELAKSDEVNQSITQPVIETGLCKNLLQEYAQKMNYAMPLYLCKKDERPGRLSSYSCTVEIGGIRYIGASARTKKEAEIKAARTALLAIESSASHSSEKQFGPSKLTVVPCKKRVAEPIGKVGETSKVPKAKKTRFKRKPPRKKESGDKKGRNHIESANHIEANGESYTNVNDESCVQTLESGTEALQAVDFDNGVSVDYQNENGVSSGEGLLSLNSSKALENGESMEVQSTDSCIQTMKYGPFSASSMKNFDAGMLSDHQNDNGMLAGDDSLSLNSNKVFGNGNATELPNTESSLNSNKAFGNGNSTELPTNESSFQIIESSCGWQKP
ncbi:double-stranded RNA-binding protein 1 [Neltuma alba]|uniref:double-stranded RNA-binding protein 1 n=1 Tax=Neltuma alba TaxID=207710 RepID=UPI0010A31E5F|nr:double-stranded RNA-binding protein 1-like [Prosopis alba]